MPIITVDTWPMPKERKPELMKKITKVFTDWGIPAQAVTILILKPKWIIGERQENNIQ